ncbi:MAG: response regulator, partial [Undibacterium curvum]|uniref:response regulator n=1 Tax=Undibacterium curvum TaxID=2762294 RepID=UPI003BDDD2D6
MLAPQQRSKVMVVEDDELVSLQIQLKLELLGFDAVGATTTGEEAITLVTALQPDIVLMDIMLAGQMDGIEAAQIIHAQQQIPVVFLSGHTEEDTLSRIKQSEAFGYIIKPFT